MDLTAQLTERHDQERRLEAAGIAHDGGGMSVAPGGAGTWEIFLLDGDVLHSVAEVDRCISFEDLKRRAAARYPDFDTYWQELMRAQWKLLQERGWKKGDPLDVQESLTVALERLLVEPIPCDHAPAIWVMRDGSHVVYPDMTVRKARDLLDRARTRRTRVKGSIQPDDVERLACMDTSHPDALPD